MSASARRCVVPRACGGAVAAVLGALLAGRVAAAPPDDAPPPPPAPPAAVTAAEPRAWDWAVVPIIYYQPETGFGGGAQVAVVRTASSGAPGQDRHDTIGIFATATMRKQYGVGV